MSIYYVILLIFSPEINPEAGTHLSVRRALLMDRAAVAAPFQVPYLQKHVSTGGLLSAELLLWGQGRRTTAGTKGMERNLEAASLQIPSARLLFHFLKSHTLLRTGSRAHNLMCWVTSTSRCLGSACRLPPGHIFDLVVLMLQ